MEQDIESRIEKRYNQYADALYRHAYFRCGNRDDARDIVQDVFIKYALYLRKEKKIDNDKSFLYQSVRNRVIDYFRKKKTDSLDMLAEGGFDPSKTSDHEDIFQQSENKQLVILLHKLENDRYREVLLLRYIEGLEVNEIATLLEETANVVSVRLNRATTKLKILLNGSDT